MKSKQIRRRIFSIIERSSNKSSDTPSTIYDLIMMVTIFASLIPLTFKGTNQVFDMLDKLTVSIFIADYILRLITADLKLKRGWISFLLYPFTFMAIIDILSILPSFTALSSGFKSLKVLRMFRTFRVFRSLKVFKAFKLFRYSKSIDIISNVIRKQKEPLLAVATLAAGYILIAALVIFNVEPDTFNNYFDAIYWATVSLTTMGYGDIYPVSTAGRIVTMISSFVGIAIVALPSGIITAGYTDAVSNKKNDSQSIVISDDCSTKTKEDQLDSDRSCKSAQNFPVTEEPDPALNDNSDTFQKDLEMMKYFQDEFKFRQKNYWDILIKFFTLTVVISILPIASQVFGVELNPIPPNLVLLFPLIGFAVAIISLVILLDEAKKMCHVNHVKYAINKTYMQKKYRYEFYNNDFVGNAESRKDWRAYWIPWLVFSLELIIIISVCVIILFSSNHPVLFWIKQ